MAPSTLLRTAAVIALLQGVAHTVLIVVASPKHGPEEIAVIEAMKSHRFDFLGAKRSYWDFYFGYALIAAIICFVEAALFWQVAAAANVGAGLIQSVTVIFIAFNLVHALLAWRYFFVTPIVPDLIIVVCLVLAFLRAAA
jgi:hypothetical protein